VTFVSESISAWGVLTVCAVVIAAPVWWFGLRTVGRLRAEARSAVDRGASQPDRPGTLLVVAALVLLANQVLLSVPRLGFFDDLAWNWQGKALALAASVTLIALWPTLRSRDVGLTMPRRDAWRPTVLLCVAAVLVFVVVDADAATRGSYLESLLFQATMPGIEEELLFRGVLWALVDRALPRKRMLLGAPIGMGFVVSTVAFGLAHGIVLADGQVTALVLGPVIFTGVAGAVLGWVRARADSIIPAIVLHNVVNVAVHVAG
jgi:uncharacterized protein